MDYKELIEALKSILPEKVLYGDLIGAEGVYAHSGPMVYADPEPYFIEQAITAITDLLDRAENAEAQTRMLEQANISLAVRASNAEYRAASADERAEKAERGRDVATNRMKDIISGNIYPCEVCKHRWKCALFKPQRKCDYFEYGKKEE